MKKLIELKIQAHKDREAVIMALANSGYIVTVEEKNKKSYSMSNGDFFVIVWEREHE